MISRDHQVDRFPVPLSVVAAVAAFLVGSVYLGSSDWLTRPALTTPGPTLAVDHCGLNEDQIRQLWVSASLHSKDEAARTKLTTELIRAAENLCRSAKEPALPLPSELQRLIR